MESSPDKPSSSADEIWNNFIKEAPFVIGDSQPWCLPQEVGWFDQEQYTRGRVFIKEYFALNCCLIWFGTTVSAIVKPTSGVFFRNHQMYPDNAFFEKNLKGLKLAMGWIYDYDMQDIKSMGTKQYRILRGVHVKFAHLKPNHDVLPLPDHLIPDRCHQKAKEIREIFQDIPVPDVPAEITSWHPPLPFSQFDTALSGFGVMAPFWTTPIISENVDQCGLSAFAHVVALGNRTIGIEDGYNLALYQSRELYMKVMGLIYIFLKEIDATVCFLLEPSVNFTSKFGITLNVLLYFTAEQAGGDHGKLWVRMKRTEKITVGLMNKSVLLYMKFRPVRILANMLCRIAFKILFYIYLKPSRDSREMRKVNGMSSYYH